MDTKKHTELQVSIVELMKTANGEKNDKRKDRQVQQRITILVTPFYIATDSERNKTKQIVRGHLLIPSENQRR